MVWASAGCGGLGVSEFILQRIHFLKGKVFFYNLTKNPNLTNFFFFFFFVGGGGG